MSTPDRISCTGTITKESEVFETNAASGNSTTRVYIGAKSLLIAQRTIEATQGATALKLESTADGNYRLTCGYNFDLSAGGAGADLPVNAHELENDLEQVDVWNSEVMRNQLYTAFGSSWAAVGGAVSFLKGAVEQWDADPTKGPNQVTTAEARFNIYTNADQKALMLNLFRGIAYHQIRNCPQFNSVYRRRITAASPLQVSAAFTGAGRIWTTAEVVAWEGVPSSSWWFVLPADKKWLKNPPTVNTVAGQKTEIVYTYTAAADWWNGTFQAHSGATLLSF